MRRPGIHWLCLVGQSAGLKFVFQFIAEVKTTSPNSQPVLWVNDLTKRDCARALQIGVRGVLKKTLPVESVVACLRSVGRGDLWIDGFDSLAPRATARLTPREKEIVHHICAGLKNKEIAVALTITAGTVKVHLMHIFEKTGVKDRFELAAHGQRILGIETTMESAQAASKAQINYASEYRA